MINAVKKALPIFAIALFLASFSVGEAAAQNKLREIVNRMDAHNKNLTTLRARVTMVKTNAQLGDSDTQVGTVIYAKAAARKPNVRLDWDRPKETLAVKGGEYIIYRPETGTAITGSTDSAKGGTKASSALAFMNMSKAELNANYTVALLGENETLSSGVQTLHLQLTPKNKASYKAAELWVDPDGMPHQTKIIEQNNDTTTVLLQKLEKNVKLNGSDFEVKIKPGTKITKG